MVVTGGNQYVGVKVSGGGGSGGGRGWGEVVTEGTKRKTPRTEHQKRLQVSNFTN